MSDFRIGLFYPNSPSVHLMSPLSKELNPNIRGAQTHIDIMGAAEGAGLDYVFIADAWGPRGEAALLYELGDPILMGPILAALLIAASKNIKVINTMHQSWLHPLQIARMGANLASLSGDRWGMNAVSGAGMAPELVKAVSDVTDHDDLYAVATESMEVILEMFENDGEVHHQGKYFQADGRMVGPWPDPPHIVSAGASPRGCEFAGKFASAIYIPGPSEMPAEKIIERREMIKAEARKAGRADADDIKILVNTQLVIAETQSEADALSKRLTDTLDPNAMKEMHSHAAAMSTTYKDIVADKGMFTEWTAGDPERIADQIEEIQQSGVCDGLSLSFLVFQPELIKLFGDEVVPILEKRGVWTSAEKRGWPW
jgi:FMNH2-dependent dimethyl sulfone monooxygenase